MEFEKGTVVISRAGRDKGYFMLVVGGDGKFAFVADGKERPLERPKKKNPIHLQKTNFRINSERLTNKSLRAALREFAKGER